MARIEISRIEVVKTDSSRSHELHLTPFEQHCIAARARTHNERIRIANGSGRDSLRLKRNDLSKSAERFVQERNMSINYDAHA